MARAFASASSQYMQFAGGVVTAYPFTIATWFNRTTSATFTLFGIGASASDNFWQVSLTSGGAVTAASQSGGGGTGATSSTTVSTGTNAHACGVFASATSRSAYLNGGGKVTDTTSNTPAGTLNLSTIGALDKNGGRGFYFNGSLWEVGLWSVALDDAEVAALAAGYAPTLIRPTSLVSYWPLTGNESPEPDRWKTRNDMTLAAAAPTKSDHGRIIYPTGPNSTAICA